ncbi:unannotated protein [freshwater metagenome]|uniref:Unannotated protein n=1 Tax=freshwater metagenome TaxID=449393 RepID=A0A6J6K3V2_9ZZZZ
MRRAWIRRIAVPSIVLAVIGASILVGCASPVLIATCSKRLVASQSAPIANAALTEISGIAASRANPGLLWVHNDSGDSARIFGLDGEGITHTTLSLNGASAIDWEDIAVGRGPVAAKTYIYVGDIGDNNSVRSEIVIYRVAEPVVDLAGSVSGSLSGVDAIRLRYPDGAHNAESLLVDPATGEIVVITKSMSGGAQNAYRVSGSVIPGVLTTMEYLATITTSSSAFGAITGADISPNGLQLALRTYGGVAVSARPDIGTPLSTFIAGGAKIVACAGPAPSEAQGEAVGFNSNGRGFITVSEGVGAVLHRFVAP